MVAFFDFFDEKMMLPPVNIKWELSCAEKYKKRIIVFKKNSETFSTQIYEKDYSEKDIDKLRYSIYSLDKVVEYFKGETEWRIENNLLHQIRNSYYENVETQSASDENHSKGDREKSNNNKKQKISLSNEDKMLLLEQYRIMIETSEKLMERRQTVGSLYTTICTALLAFIGASFAVENLILSALTTLMSGIIIIVLCYNWRSSLNAYDLNNSGKFAVINQIEKHLPADMFECEYRYNTLNGIRSYSAREKLLPTIFASFGVILIALSIVLIFMQIF